ncbi:MAG TPA: HAMP domain-containing sensor histidine kinase [Firmicutes bacterium]|nr:HAMP domain-containing sensor histidine kinase [Bacillota bacterium]
MSYKHIDYFLNRMLIQLMLIGLILLINIFLLIYLLIQKLTSPLEGLILGTQSLADGNFEYNFDTEQEGELGHLARSFNEMKFKLNQANKELVKSNKELMNLNEYTKNIIDSMKSSLIALNKSGKIMLFSEGRKNLPLKISYPLEGMNLREVFPQLPFNVTAKVNDIMKNRGGYSELKNFALDIDGKEFFFDFFFSSINDKDENFIGILIILDDVTEKVFLEERLSQSQKLAALGEFSAAIAHEIRNPLGIIKVSASSVKENIDRSDSSYKLLDFIIGETDRLAKVVEKLLNFARPKKIEKEFTDLKDMIRSFIKYGMQNLKEKNIEFQEEFGDDLPKVMIDRTQFSEVMINMIDNAIDSIPEDKKGIIKISTKFFPKNNKVQIRIKDNGIGMKENDKIHIFEPFFTTKDLGTGLGLTISHKVVENHNGSITVETEMNKGSEFIILIPAE